MPVHLCARGFGRLSGLLLLGLWLAAFLSACRPDYTNSPLMTQVHYASANYTLRGGTMSAINYRDGETPVPVGTPVRVTHIDDEFITVSANEGAASFRFVTHKAFPMTIDKVFLQFFSATPPTDAIARLTDEERANVEAAQVVEGMGKAAVLLAIGPPPPHRTPDRSGSVWTYWQSRSKTFKVHFDLQGVVTKIEGLDAVAPAEDVPAEAPTAEVAPARELMYARCNVHFEGGKVDWANYQRGPVIAHNTQVEVVAKKKSSVTFKDTTTGATYTFRNEAKESGQPTWALFTRLFATDDQAPKLAALSAEEQQRVRGAEVAVGMGRAAVEMAICPPPPHKTPSLDSSQWWYWQSRFDRFMVTFDREGRVSEIKK